MPAGTENGTDAADDVGSEDGDGTGGDGTGGDGTGGDGTGGGDGGSEEAEFNLVASPDNASCAYVPNGSLSGADLLNVFFFFLIIGANPEDVESSLAVRGGSDTGLSASAQSRPNNQASNVAQLDLRPSDFGQAHRLTITVDADDQIRETDESDNSIRVDLELPSPRPSVTVDPLACSVSPR